MEHQTGHEDEPVSTARPMTDQPIERADHRQKDEE